MSPMQRMASKASLRPLTAPSRTELPRWGSDMKSKATTNVVFEQEKTPLPSILIGGRRPQTSRAHEVVPKRSLDWDREEKSNGSNLYHRRQQARLQDPTRLESTPRKKEGQRRVSSQFHAGPTRLAVPPALQRARFASDPNIARPEARVSIDQLKKMQPVKIFRP
jgi:hypothetical protein